MTGFEVIMLLCMGGACGWVLGALAERAGWYE